MRVLFRSRGGWNGERLVHRTSARPAGERGVSDQRRGREPAGERQGEVRGSRRGREDNLLAARGGAWEAGAWVAAESGFGSEPAGAGAEPDYCPPDAAASFAGGG